MLIGAVAGFVLAQVIIFTFTVLDYILWKQNYKEYGNKYTDRPTWIGSGFYIAYKLRR